MLFNSFEFLLFLPTVFLLFWTLCRTRQSQNLLLIAASYLFYGWWDARFLALIVLITLVSYLSGLALERLDTSRAGRRTVLWCAAAIDIGVLVAFKYFDFFAAAFARVLGAAGMEADPVTLGLVLPVGISFYTFQALSYTIDVYRRQIRPTHDTAAFFVFISFFPQLVAGPIERATNILPQFMVRRTFDYAAAVSGMRLILWGLFKKMVVADNAAPVVDAVFADYAGAGTANLWVGAVLFSLQIYCDFSGYSDIAIGTARLFGVNLMRNFDKPYFARDIADFWRRWHISLTTWFRDYIYIPLGGNRRGTKRTVANTMTVFLVSGLWHGANYTFVAWGAYHALLFVPLLLLGKTRRDTRVRRHGWLPAFRESTLMAVTFLLVAVGWVMFRAVDIQSALHYISLMFSDYTPGHLMGKSALMWGALLLAAEALTPRRETPFDLSPRGLWRYRAVRWSAYALLFVGILIFAGSSEEFIYFKF